MDFSNNNHWAFQTARKVIKDKGNRKEYVCASGVTPSGTIHFGNVREFITVDIISKAITLLGKKSRYLHSWDSYDVFRKVPKDMPKQAELKKFLRKPIVDTPDPYGCHESYAAHHMQAAEADLAKVDINPEFINQADQYRSCVYADEIKTALEHSENIRTALNKYREEDLAENWLPVSIFCDSCNKDTIKHIEYEGGYSLRYTCDCGHDEVVDFQKKGIVKLLWRIDWPMRWHYEKVDFEPGGKEHSTQGGSYTTAREIANQVWHIEPPTYLMYDFISIKGRGGKISSSVGDVVTLADVLEVYEPMMARWLFTGSRPGSEFAVSFDLDLLSSYEKFDKMERIYYGEQEASDKDKDNAIAMYTLSQVGKLPSKMPVQPSLRHITNMLQTFDMDEEKTIAYFPAKTAFDKLRVKTRVTCAKNWLDKYAPEDMKFSIKDKKDKTVAGLLSEQQKESLKQFHTILEGFDRKVSDPDILATPIFDIPKSMDMNMKDFFTGSYLCLIGKEKGPKLAPFILEMGIDRAQSIIAQYI